MLNILKSINLKKIDFYLTYFFMSIKDVQISLNCSCLISFLTVYSLFNDGTWENLGRKIAF